MERTAKAMQDQNSKTQSTHAANGSDMHSRPAHLFSAASLHKAGYEPKHKSVQETTYGHMPLWWRALAVLVVIPLVLGLFPDVSTLRAYADPNGNNAGVQTGDLQDQVINGGTDTKDTMPADKNAESRDTSDSQNIEPEKDSAGGHETAKLKDDETGNDNADTQQDSQQSQQEAQKAPGSSSQGYSSNGALTTPAGNKDAILPKLSGRIREGLLGARTQGEGNLGEADSSRSMSGEFEINPKKVPSEYRFNDTGSEDYTILYDMSEGGQLGESAPTGGQFDALFTVSHPTRTGYTFTGWEIRGMDSCSHTIGNTTTDKTELTGEDKTLETTFMNLRETEGTVTFKPVWTPNTYKITINKNITDGVSDFGTEELFVEFDNRIYYKNAQSQEINISRHDGRLEIPKRNGYSFGGYYTLSPRATNFNEADCLIDEEGYVTDKFSLSYYDDAKTGSSRAAVLYPLWIANTYEVELDLTGALDYPDVQVSPTMFLYYKYDDKLYLDEDCTQAVIRNNDPSLILPKREGYTFSNYVSKYGDSEKIIIRASNSGTPVIAVSNNELKTYLNPQMLPGGSMIFELEARWAPVEYTVTYNNNKAPRDAQERDIQYNGMLPYDAGALNLPLQHKLTYDDVNGVLVTDPAPTFTNPELSMGRVFDYWQDGNGVRIEKQ